MSERALPIDHLIYAGRELEAMMAQFERLTGVAPGRGGRHPRMGTHNALASLGPDIYFELMAVDPQQKLGDATMGARVNALPFARLFAYMLKSRELEAIREVLGRHGIGADLFDASRQTPDGRTLKWRLLVPHDNPFGDRVPKFIDWLDTPHPAASAAAGCRFDSFEIGDPDAPRLRALLRELRADLTVHTADRPYFRLRIDSPKGKLDLTG
jgi:Glyoxalase-like domain